MRIVLVMPRSLPAVAAIPRLAQCAAAAAAALARGVHLDVSPVEQALVHCALGEVRLFHGAEFDEAEATGLPGKPVRDHLGRDDAAVRLERRAQLGVAGGIR